MCKCFVYCFTWFYSAVYQMAFIIWVGYVISSLSDISVSFSALTSGSMMKISHSDLLYKVVIHVCWSYKWSFLRQFYTFKNWSSQICINKQFYSSKRLFSSHTVLHSLKTSVHVFWNLYNHMHITIIYSFAVLQ